MFLLKNLITCLNLHHAVHSQNLISINGKTHSLKNIQINHTTPRAKNHSDHKFRKYGTLGGGGGGGKF